MKISLVFLFILGIVSALPLSAQIKRGAGVKLKEVLKDNTSEKRLALVIGNSSYINTTPLANPANDAADMAKALKELGFEVLFGTNQTLPQMRKMIREFGMKLQAQKGVGLFYYAGHGIQFNGRNFLLPIDAEIASEVETEDAGIDLNMVLHQMDAADNGFNLVILDACRNNPFARSWHGARDAGKNGGLARVDAPTGTLIAYATKPGETASDGTGRNGLYTGALLRQMRLKDVEMGKMFQQVRAEVIKQSGGRQVPFDESSVVGDFYFAGNTKAPNPTTLNNSKELPPAVTFDPHAGEREAWNQIKDSNNSADFALFVTSFPKGVYTAQANAQWEKAWWNSIKDKNDQANFAAFIKQFPAGQYAEAAKFAIKRLGATAPGVTDTDNSIVINAGTSRKNTLGMELVYIPAGDYLMGSSKAEIDDQLYECKKYNNECIREFFGNQTPKHQITIKDGFWMGKYEVTQAQWQSVMGENPSKFKACGGNCPVEEVSWEDVQAFIKRLNDKNDGFVYSLPSESQWEYAARAGTTSVFGIGNSLNSSQANFNGNFPYAADKGKFLSTTVAVGSFRPNAWGLYDMHGNVAEWCQDLYRVSYKNLPNDGSPIIGGGGYVNTRMFRGGSWKSPGAEVSSTIRGRTSISTRDETIGFRIIARPK